MADPIPPFIYSETKGSALTNLEFSNDLRMIRVAFNAFLASYVPLPSIVPTSQGGTGANLTLNGNRIIISSGAVMAENAAILPNRAIVSNGSGLPIHSITTATEIGYVNGVTSSIQTQLDGKFDNPEGTIGQYIRGNGSIANFPSGLPPGGPASGDLTGLYPNPTIGDNKVTYAKFQQVSGQRLLGNPTGSAANATEISLGTGLSFSGSQLIVSGALSQWITTGMNIYYDIGNVGIGTTNPAARLDLEGVWKYSGKNVTQIGANAGADLSNTIQNTSTTGYSSLYLLDNSSNGLAVTQYGSAYVTVGQLDISSTTLISSANSVNWALPNPYTFKVWTGTPGSLAENFRIEQSYTRSLNRVSLERGISLVPKPNITTYPYSVLADDSCLFLQAPAGSVILPDTTTIETGHIIVLESGLGAAPTVVVFNTMTENIMGATSYAMTANQTIWVQKYPLNWRIIAQFNTASGYITAVTAPLQVMGANLSIQNNGITDALLRQSAGLSVIGNTTNSTANVADITAASDFQILRRSGTSIGFGSIDLGQSAAVGSSVLAVANGGTGTSTGAWLLTGTSTLSGANTIATNSNNITFTQTSSRNTRIASDGSFQIWNGATSGNTVFDVIPAGYNTAYSALINPAGAIVTRNGVLHIQTSTNNATTNGIAITSSSGGSLFTVRDDGRVTLGSLMFTATNSTVLYSNSLALSTSTIPNQSPFASLDLTFVANTQSSGTFHSMLLTNRNSAVTGTMEMNAVSVATVFAQTGTPTGVARGFYYNPSGTILTTSHRAWENTTGNMIVGSTSGRLGINLTSPTAKLHINAPTVTTPGSGPFKLTNSGLNLLAVGEEGTFEFGTISGRKILLFSRDGTTKEAVLTGTLNTGVTTTGIESSVVIMVPATDGNVYPVAIATI